MSVVQEFEIGAPPVIGNASADVPGADALGVLGWFVFLLRQLALWLSPSHLHQVLEFLAISAVRRYASITVATALLYVITRAWLRHRKHTTAWW